MTKRTIWFGGAIAVALGASAAVGAQTVLSTPAFDTAAWKAGAGKHFGSGNARSKMAAEVAVVVKPGMTRAEVEGLLGAPDQKNRMFVYGAADGADPKTSKTILFDASGKVLRQSPELTKGVDGTGMTPNQVKAVIGEPAAIRDDYTYYLGTPGMAPDPEYLHVLFDAEGKVIRQFRNSG